MNRHKILIIFLILVISIDGLSILKPDSSKIKADFDIRALSEDLGENLPTIQRNSLLPIADLSNPEPRILRKIRVIATAYSSTPWETDSNPYLTAAGTRVRDGIIANNILPFGTMVRMPELFGDKVFVVEDRMSWKKSNYQIDIWFPTFWEAKKFGAKKTYIEILES